MTTAADIIALKALFRLVPSFSGNGLRGMGILPGRPKEDAAENDHKNQVQVERIQRNAELGVDPREEWREWKTTIASESVAHTTAGSHDRGCGEKHADEREA